MQKEPRSARDMTEAVRLGAVRAAGGPNFRIVLFWVRDEREGPIAVKDRRLGTDRRRSRQQTATMRCASHTSRRYIVDRTETTVMCVASLAAPRLAAGSAPEMAACTGGSLSHLTRLFTPTATARRRTASPGAREQRAGRRSVWGSRLGVTRQAACDAAPASVEGQHLDLDLGSISALLGLSWPLAPRACGSERR